MDYISSLPDVAMLRIYYFLSYDDIAKFRAVSKNFNEFGKSLLSSGFKSLKIRFKKKQSGLNAFLPKRESKRKNHPLHGCSKVYTEVSSKMLLLEIAFIRYINTNQCCFIPGKIIDEIEKIIYRTELLKKDILLKNQVPMKRENNAPAKNKGNANVNFFYIDPSGGLFRDLLSELSDLTSIAIEHFQETIAPTLKHSYSDSFKYRSLSESNIYIVPEIQRQTSLTAEDDNNDLAKKVHSLNYKMDVMVKHATQQRNTIKELSSSVYDGEVKLNKISQKLDEFERKYNLLSAVLAQRDTILPLSRSNQAVQCSSSSYLDFDLSSDSGISVKRPLEFEEEQYVKKEKIE